MTAKHLLAIAAFALTGCSGSHTPGEEGQGTVVLGLTPQSQTVVVTKAAAVPAAEDFTLTIRNAVGNGYEESWPFGTFLSSLGGKKTLDIGSYTAVAEHGDNSEGFDKPYYYGSENFTIRDGETTPVRLTAAIANVKITVGYTDALTGYFTDYTTTVTSAAGTRLVYAKADYDGKEGFVRPSDFDIEVAYTKQNGTRGTATYTVTGATARQHYKLTYNVNNGEVGNATITVTFSDEFEEIVLDTIELNDQQ